MRPLFSKKSINTALSLLGLFVLANAQQSSQAAERCYYIDDPSNRDNVTFTSDAPVEVVNGHTTQIKGKVCLDSSFQFDAKHPFSVSFDVDLNSIDTGIPLRNQHLRENFLQTDKFPKAIFRATSVKLSKKPPFKAGEVVTVTANGQFTVHGKTQPKSIVVKVTNLPESESTRHRFSSGDLIRVKATFPVELQKYNIERPTALFYKLADTVFVTVDAVGTSDKDALK